MDTKKVSMAAMIADVRSAEAFNSVDKYTSKEDIKKFVSKYVLSSFDEIREEWKSDVISSVKYLLLIDDFAVANLLAEQLLDSEMLALVPESGNYLNYFEFFLEEWENRWKA